MTVFPLIPEKDIGKKPLKKQKISQSEQTIFNIETSKMYKVDPWKATANELPLFAYTTNIAKNRHYREAIVLDIRKELKKVKENINKCDFNTLTDLCKVSKLVDIHSKYMYFDPSFDLLERDVMKTQQDFIDNCKLSSKPKK